MILRIRNQIILLKNVAYYSRLLTILVALRKLRKKGIYWNNQKNPTNLYKRNYTLICFLRTYMANTCLNKILKPYPRPCLA
jgi:hypothetical protein